MNIHYNKKGFTLIELIIIIIMLGILAVVAIPKYMQLKVDSHDGVAKGVLASLRGAESMLFAKYVINGTTAAYTIGDLMGNIAAQGGVTLGTNTADVGGQTYTFVLTGPTLPTERGEVTVSGKNW
jgi:MSHA pilin protein MshA